MVNIDNWTKISDLCKKFVEELDLLVSDVTGPKEEAPAPAPIKIEDVRRELAEASRSGKTAEVRELLKKHGAAKLSEIKESEYAELLKEAKNLNNAG